MNTLKKTLEQREQPELIAIIQHLLRQEPDLQWLLMTPLPTASTRKSPVDPEVYRQQVLAGISSPCYAHSTKRKYIRDKSERMIYNETCADKSAYKDILQDEN